MILHWQGTQPRFAAYTTAAAAALGRVAGMIKKAVYRSAWRRVRGEDDMIPAIKTAARDLPLDVLRPWPTLAEYSITSTLCSAGAGSALRECISHAFGPEDSKWDSPGSCNSH